MKKDTLDKLDEYFETKSQSESSVIFAGAGLVVALIVYLLSFDPSIQYFETNDSRYRDIDTKLANTKHYIKSKSSADGDTNFEINRQTQSLNLLKAELDKKHNENEYFDKRLKELSHLLFNEKNWANFLDSVVLLAKSNGIQILKINNEFKNPSHQRIEQFLNIDIDVKGNFKNIIGYINKLEESKLVVDLNKIDMNTTSNELNARLGISVWGMKY